MKNLYRSAVAATLLAVSGIAVSAPLSITAIQGGTPTGAVRLNFDALALGSGTRSIATALGTVTVNLTPGAAVVVGSVSGQYAAPFLSGGNGTGFGSPDQPNGLDTTPYLTSGSTGATPAASIEFLLPGLQKYFGLLWGSIDDYNTLRFYDGTTLVGTVTGADVTATPDGNQGLNGTRYVNIVDGGTGFNRVIATSSEFAFEFDNVAFNPTTDVPEPATLALLGLGLAGLGLVRRRRR